MCTERESKYIIIAITGSTIFIFTYMDSQWQIQKIVLCGGGVWQLCVPEDHQCPLMERWRGLLYIVQNLGGGGDKATVPPLDLPLAFI